MNFRSRFLSRLTAPKDIATEPASKYNDKWTELKVDDKVKKQIIVRTSWKDCPTTYAEEFYYGKIILIDDGYAVVKYKHLRNLEREMLKDLIWVPEHEWKNNSGAP